MNHLEILEGKFCEASNALRDEQRRLGFWPGAKVIAQYGDNEPKNGVIAEYGGAWTTVDALSVPVIMEEGFIQPWTVSNLTLSK